MLQNVRHTGRIGGYCAQCHQEYVFAVVRSQMVMHGAGSAVLVLLNAQLQRFDLVAAQQPEGGVAYGSAGGNLVHTGPVQEKATAYSNVNPLWLP